MLQIYCAENIVDAQLFKDRLGSHGIEAVIKGGYLSGAVGELPAQGLISVWIVDAIFETQARKQLAEFEEQQRRQAHDVFCGNCGNCNPGSFDLCWFCNQDLKQKR